MHQHQLSPEMQACVDECQRCQTICLGMAMNHCLELGGKHLEPAHFRPMIACAEICATAAKFMMIGTEHHRETCALCAVICETCAERCAAVGEMDACVEACRRCAASCREMAGDAGAAASVGGVGLAG